MKKIAIIAAALLLSVAAFAQDGKSIYNKYSDAKGVSAVYVSPAMFRLMGKLPEMNMGDDQVNFTQIVKSLTGFYLVSSENSEVSEDMKKDADKFVKSGHFEMLMEVKDDGERVNIYTVGKGDELSSVVFIAVDGEECTFISMDGKMSREQLENALAKVAQ